MTKLKHICLIFLLIVSYSVYSQKSYEFDYVMEYQYISDDGKKHNEYRFISSKNNDFMFMVWEKGNEVMMKLITDGKLYFDKIAKEDFFVEAISLRCPQKGELKSNISLNDFDFVRQNDTIINTERLAHFVINPTNKKKVDKEKHVPIHYIIDNKYNFNYPFFSPGELIFKKWKKGENIPKGILKECYSYKLGKKVQYTELVQILHLKKIIIIDNNCK